MRWLTAAITVLPWIAGACGGPDALFFFRAGTLGIGIDTRGWVVSFEDLRDGSDYLPRGHHAPLLTLRVDGHAVTPRDAVFNARDSVLILAYEDGLEVEVGVRTRGTHVTFELLSVRYALAPENIPGSEQASSAAPGTTGPGPVDLAIWGPYPTTISKIIGETVGVVRGERFAMGLQALNIKTLGGYPWNENDAMPQLDIFESGDYSDLREEGKRHVLYRVEAAKPDSFGSTLQAYTRNRFEERVIPNWGYDQFVAPPFDDGGVIGSKIALFGAPLEEALASVGAIEIAEGLPHPLIDGVWGKEARSASAAYVIMPFSESTVDHAVDVTLRAGLRYLYHPDPFESWGHFRLNRDFPNGVAGLREAVEAAEARGVHVGLHTLSNFITTNDPYVSPVPDPRLAKVGWTTLSEGVAESDTELWVEDPGFFRQLENNHLRSALVGREIVRYRAVSEDPPWRLVGVERGAFGTRTNPHAAGDSIGLLADHGYRVFLTNPELTVEMAANLAELFNETGVRQISFDGLEGNRSTGMGNYGEILFTTSWYEALSPDIKRHFIADASRTSHYFWHLYSRMNWGEPWYAGFRESQTEYRLKNQAYFSRNMMPGMLGWFRMQAVTSVEDIEWMLARSAAFDAGYAFVTSFDALEENGRSDEILELIGSWEEARMADVFSADQKERMRDIGNEFHLDRGENGGWELSQIYSTVVRHEQRDRQPGEPSHETFSFRNPAGEQSLRFVMTPVDGSVEGVAMELDGVRPLHLDVRMAEGQALVYRGGEEATLYSPQWRPLGTVTVDPSDLMVGPGDHTVLLDAVHGGSGSHLKVELRLWGDPEPVAR